MDWCLPDTKQGVADAYSILHASANFSCDISFDTVSFPSLLLHQCSFIALLLEAVGYRRWDSETYEDRLIRGHCTVLVEQFLVLGYLLRIPGVVPVQESLLDQLDIHGLSPCFIRR